MTAIITLGKAKKFFRKRKSESHKGDNGRVLIIAGSEEFAGAPILVGASALAALRGGIDLVTVLAPEKTGFVVNAYAPDLIVKKVKGKFFTKKHLKAAVEAEKKADAIAIGPGMGKEKQTLAFARETCAKAKKSIVIDADALRACAGMKFRGNALLTPHEKEFEVFTGKKIAGKGLKEKIALVKEEAARHKCIILLKGRTGKYSNIISDGKNVTLNPTGNAGMTKGGTGDVLAGLCAAYIALGATPFEAAQAAALVNGSVGDALKMEKGFGFTASDFAGKIPEWTKKLLK